MTTKPSSRTRRALNAAKVDPKQIKGLAYVLLAVLAGGATNSGFLTQKIEQAKVAATSLVETNATHAKELLTGEVTRLTGIIDNLKTSAKTEIEQAQQRIEETRLNAEKFQASVTARFKNIAGHEHIFDNWSAPQQIEGGFIQPQFFQSRACKICGEAELKKAQRP